MARNANRDSDEVGRLYDASRNRPLRVRAWRLLMAFFILLTLSSACIGLAAFAAARTCGC